MGVPRRCLLSGLGGPSWSDVTGASRPLIGLGGALFLLFGGRSVRWNWGGRRSLKSGGRGSRWGLRPATRLGNWSGRRSAVVRGSLSALVCPSCLWACYRHCKSVNVTGLVTWSCSCPGFQVAVLHSSSQTFAPASFSQLPSVPTIGTTSPTTSCVLACPRPRPSATPATHPDTTARLCSSSVFIQPSRENPQDYLVSLATRESGFSFTPVISTQTSKWREGVLFCSLLEAFWSGQHTYE